MHADQLNLGIDHDTSHTGVLGIIISHNNSLPSYHASLIKTLASGQQAASLTIDYKYTEYQKCPPGN